MAFSSWCIGHDFKDLVRYREVELSKRRERALAGLSSTYDVKTDSCV